jgi:hypothetical protein
MMRRLIVAALALLTAASCRPDARSETDRAAGAAAGAGAGAAAGAATTTNAPPAAGHYSLQDFARLRWLEGNWRGQLPDRSYFYERYRFLNDSTIAMHGFADSTLARATDSATLTLRGGAITDAGASAQWVATHLDSSAVDFAPVHGSSDPFSWARESPTRWTATLRSGDPARPRTTVYRMERVGH